MSCQSGRWALASTSSAPVPQPATNTAAPELLARGETKHVWAKAYLALCDGFPDDLRHDLTQQQIAATQAGSIMLGDRIAAERECR